MKRKLQNAYAMADFVDAKRALQRLHRELMDGNPSAARSLEETLIVHKRPLVAPTGSSQPSPPRGDDLLEFEMLGNTAIRSSAGLSSGLLVAKRQFRKVRGHRQIPLLLSPMAISTEIRAISSALAARSR